MSPADGDTPGRQRLIDTLARAAARVEPIEVRGRITRVQGTIVRATMSEARIGEEQLLRDPVTRAELKAEVVGFDGDEVLLSPLGEISGLSNRAEVIQTSILPSAPSGPSLLGRVLDAFGQPLDDAPLSAPRRPLTAPPPGALTRPRIDAALETGVRAIDGALTLGRGQRVGIFGAAGTGKSGLLAQIVRNAEVDAVVVGLVGERGREVGEFLHQNLSGDARARSVIVIATSDRPAPERVRAASTATAVAESLRDEGLSVLLVLDSITRVARAFREIGLAAGEPPTRRGFPPSTFAALPKLLERAGRSETGSITAIYSILVEGDDDDADPVADEMRGLLDGHIVLSRRLAAMGHYPAIDILKSSSRVMDAVATPAHLAAAQRISAHLAKLDEVELLVQVGEYRAGSDAEADAALAAKDRLTRFLRQGPGERSAFDDTVKTLSDLAS